MVSERRFAAGLVVGGCVGAAIALLYAAKKGTHNESHTATGNQKDRVGQKGPHTKKSRRASKESPELVGDVHQGHKSGGGVRDRNPLTHLSSAEG